MRPLQGRILLVAGLAVVVAALVAMSMGAVQVPPTAWWSMLAGGEDHSASQQAVLLVVRLPRVLLALLAGAALAVGGATMQALFRNPLADPSIIGVSSGAGLLAAVAITATASLATFMGAWVGPVALPAMAFVGALVSALLVFGIARDGRRTNVAAMLLAGIGITAIAGALTGLLTYTATDTQLRSITFWMLGSLGGADRTAILIMLVAVPLPMFVLLRSHRQFNALALGEQQARYLGVDVEKVKRRAIMAISIMVGASVALCGVIGFLGLVVPHAVRMLGGADNRYVMPASLFGGALLLCLADTMARTMAAPAEIPIGVITALCGAPVFLYLLVRRKRTLAM